MVNRVMVQAVARHVLNALGAALVARGVIDEATWAEAAAGVATVVGAVAWSLYEKRSGAKS